MVFINMCNLKGMENICELIDDKNKEIRNAADKCLDLIGNVDNKGDKVKKLKFEVYNKEWLEMMEDCY